VTSAVTSVGSEMSLPSLSSTSAGARCPSCFLPSIVVCCCRRHLSRADMDKTRPAAGGRPAAATAGTSAAGRADGERSVRSVRPSGRLMMRRPATRGYSAVSAVSDLSGINRRPTDQPARRPRSRLPCPRLTAVASPAGPSRWTGSVSDARLDVCTCPISV